MARVLQRLQRVATQLGWGSLTVCEHIHAPQRIRWYEAGEDECGLMITQAPLGQDETFAACVFAIRYRLCSGYHLFPLPSAAFAATHQPRLHLWLAQSWFEDLDARRSYRRAHPECAGFTWRRLRECQAPYLPFPPRGQRFRRTRWANYRNF